MGGPGDGTLEFLACESTTSSSIYPSSATADSGVDFIDANVSHQVFFTQEQVMFEAACENNKPPRPPCDTDQLRYIYIPLTITITTFPNLQTPTKTPASFKAYFARFLASSTKWMPQLYPLVSPYLARSASAAAQQCSGTAPGIANTACGFKWTLGSTWDGTSGVGQQMDALEVIQAMLIEPAQHPVTADTGGISHGNPSAGTGGDLTTNAPIALRPITTGDKAGAGVLTAIVILGFLGMTWWII